MVYLLVKEWSEADHLRQTCSLCEDEDEIVEELFGVGYESFQLYEIENQLTGYEKINPNASREDIATIVRRLCNGN